MINDPTPAAAEARATKATEDEEHAEWLHRGIDFALTRLCKWMGVEPASVSWDAATETVEGDVSAVIGNIMRAKMGEDWSPEAKDGAAPSPAAQPWDKRDRTLDPDDIADCYQRSPPAAPAAPSPDLAALELLAWRLDRVWEEDTLLGYALRFTISDAAALATALRSAILHLKAQPNAGPSADGGKEA